MRTKKIYAPDLNELAFTGRNKDYGSYLLRKKYPGRLLIAFVCSALITTGIALTPFLIYMFETPDLSFNDAELYEVEYNFIPNPEEDLATLAKMIARPPSPSEPVPVVVDSVVEKKEVKKPSEIIPDEKKEEEESADTSAANSKGQLKEGQGSSDGSGIYTTLDVFPKFPGGDQARLYYLRSSVKYPPLAMKMGVQGEVLVLFVIEPDGSVSNISVNKGIGRGCDEEAVRVTQAMPRWEPGRRSGKAVRVLVRMPIVFKIPGGKK